MSKFGFSPVESLRRNRHADCHHLPSCLLRRHTHCADSFTLYLATIGDTFDPNAIALLVQHHPGRAGVRG